MSDLLLPFVFIENRLPYFVVPWVPFPCVVSPLLHFCRNSITVLWGPSLVSVTSASSRYWDRRGTQVWRLSLSLFLCSCLGKLPSTNTFVAHTLSVGYLLTCPSVEMAVCLIPGPEAGSIKPRCQSPVSQQQETSSSGDPSPNTNLKNTEASNIPLTFSCGFWLEHNHLWRSHFVMKKVYSLEDNT